MIRLFRSFSIFFFLSIFFSFCGHSQSSDKEAFNYIEEAKKHSGKQALPFLESALDVCQGGCADSIMGSLYRRYGVAYFQGHLDKNKALDFTNQAIEYFIKAYGPGHPKVTSCQFNKSIIAKRMGKFDESAAGLLGALNSIELTTGLSIPTRDSIKATYLWQLSRLGRSMGDYDMAEVYAKEGLEVANTRWNEPHEMKILINYSLGDIQFLQQNYEPALPFFLECLANKAAYPEKNKYELIGIYEMIGLCYTNLGQLEQAQGNFENARQILRATPSEEFDKNPFNYQRKYAYLYANFQILYTRQQRWGEAEAAYQYALEHAKLCYENERDPIFAHLYKDRSILEMEQGRFEEALSFCQKAKSVVLGDAVDINSNTAFIGTPYELLEIIALEATLLGKTGNMAQAIAQYETYDQVIGLSRLRVRAPISKSFLIDSAKPVYEKAIALCIEEYNQTGDSQLLEQAFQFNAANKAVLLFEEQQGTQAIVYSGIPEETVMEEEKLRHKLIDLQKQLTSNNEQIVDSLSQLYSSEQKKYDLLLRRMEQQYPAYYELKYAVNQTVDPKLIQQKLAPSQALIEYFIGEKDLFVFVLTAGKLEVKQIPMMEGWEEDLLLLHELFTNSIEEDCEQQFIELSHRFYNWLLAPTLAGLPNESINRLLIIPDGLLTLLPFEALLTKQVEKIRGSNGFLLEEFALSYNYSSRALLQLKRENADRDLAFFAGFGMEYDDLTLAKANEMGLGRIEQGYPSKIQCQNQAIASRDLGYLEYSDDEVIGISDLLGGEKWLNGEATKQVFMEQAGNYEILHLAMHGTIDPVEPLNSSLIFTYQDSSEFLLSAADIYTMELNGQMVVLSACNTAAGAWSSGTGPMSLSRAFHYAGMPSVVASLWSIPDHSTAGLMRLFYDNLADGLPKDIALQQAKINYLNDDAMSSPLSRDPAFWAGPVVIGDASPIDDVSSNYTFWKLTFLIIAAIILSFFIWRRLSRRG